MEKVNRTRCVLLSLLCLTPSLFFWALKSLPIDYSPQTAMVYFSGATRLEFIVCGFIFPLLALGLGWNAYRGGEDKSLSLTVIAFAMLELAGMLIAAAASAAI